MTTRRGRSEPKCDAATLPRFQHGWLPVCKGRGGHWCVTRAAHARAFFDHALVHTKGRYARSPFHPRDWQLDILEPLFGNVIFDPQTGMFRRQYRQAWVEIGRKNGKSELLAGMALYLLVGDGEDGAEVYGAAKDRDQARIIWDVAARMVQLSPVLSRRTGLRVKRNEHRIVDERSGSFYTTIARDALGNLGRDPHGVLFDEVIAQPDDRLWNAMRTAMGSRVQPLLVAATTAGDDPSSFAATEHRECVQVAESPQRAPHRLVYIRNTPPDADPWDEANWVHANPALGDFLSLDALREEAVEARNDPSKENAFRQFRLNQWVSQSVRWMQMDTYATCCGDIWPRADWNPTAIAGREVWVGLDLSAQHDLTSMCVFAPGAGDEPGDAAWFHWLPEDALPALNQVTSNQATGWVRAGFLRLMDGAVIDYRALCEQIGQLLGPYKVREISYDRWSGEYVRQELERLLGKRVPLVANDPGFIGMTVPMRELMNLTLEQGWRHHGNPVAQWCFEAVEVKRAVDNPELIKPVKPARTSSARRIDAVVSAALAVGAWKVRGQQQPKRRLAVGF